jgi:hypothetical protein
VWRQQRPFEQSEIMAATEEAISMEETRERLSLTDQSGNEQSRQEDPSPVAAYSVFTKSQKWYIVAMVSVSAFFSPISATIFLPALTDIAQDLNVSINAINTTVTVYMVFQGLSPSIWGR